MSQIDPPTESEQLDSSRLDQLIHALDAIRKQALAQAEELAPQIQAADPRLAASARNLVHYLALRNSDVRTIQPDLAELGLSSLGRSEAHTLTTLNAVRSILYALRDHAPIVPAPCEGLGFDEGRAQLRENARALLGPEPQGRQVRIMVTLPGQAADDYHFVRQLVEAGMNVARVNCAHDDPAVWKKMIQHVRDAAQESGCECKVLMDLAGPKIRTGPLEPGPRVLRSRPERDAQGKVRVPARVLFVTEGVTVNTEIPNTVVIPLAGPWPRVVHSGDQIHFTDTRGRKRMLQVVGATEHSIFAGGDRTSYFKTGMRLQLKSSGRHDKQSTRGSLTVGELKRQPGFILLKRGDLLVLTRDSIGTAAVQTETGLSIEPARIACTVPQVVDALRVGERVKFDDGMIAGVVRKTTSEGAILEITLAREGGSKLRAEKGINVPDTELAIRGMTDEDRANLDFVAEHADMVALSFVNSVQDVIDLQTELAARRKPIGVLLKIETRAGFEQLPRLLLQLMQSYPAGIMIARGDLAVELGWERMAEVQEEVLWLCEAAHLPTVWATQVLEQLAKTGLPSRAEITDAAMAQRAECVMLNKGPHILDAISMLSGILGRMQGHQAKKTSLLRSLSVTHALATYNGSRS